MSLVSRLSRLSYGNRLATRPSFQTFQAQNRFIKPTLYLSPCRWGHGPPTRIGFPHYWGSMKWFPCRALLGLVLFIQFQMFGLIIWYKWDSIPYPAHRYHDENTTARNF
eukprot:25792_1